jgi:prophage tail gpP-like protein
MAALVTATLTVNGTNFSFWESVVVEREIGKPPTYATFEVAEQPNSTLTKGISSWRIGPGDAATVSLADQLVMSSAIIDMRQIYFDAGVHHVQIRVYSPVQNVITSTVDAKPGQYTKSTFMQIAQAAAGKVGVNVKLLGSPSGADKPFERVSEAPGQPIFDFVSGLATMRNLHMADDNEGNWVFFRGDTSASSTGLTLVEGQNILKARAILENNQLVPRVNTVGQNFGNDDHSGSEAQDVSASSESQTPLTGIPAQRKQTLAMPLAGDKQDAQMYADHQRSINELTSLHIIVTVAGWTCPDGSLWISKVGNNDVQTVTLNSPMIWPTNLGQSQSVFLKGVRHLQNSSEGTITELQLCNQAGLGGDHPVDSNPAG